MAKRQKNAEAAAPEAPEAVEPAPTTRMKANVAPESTLHLLLDDGTEIDLPVDADGHIDVPPAAVGKLLEQRLAKHIDGA